MKVNYNKIPYELTKLNRWCNWRVEVRNGKETKVPIDSKTLGFAKSNDDRTWSSFDTALHSINETDGLGFFFKEPYIGIDLDDVKPEIERYLNNDHEDNIVSEFVDTLGSYAEISPSGNGIHIILKGELPPEGRRKGNVEIYTSGRYFTVTGHSIGGYTKIIDDSNYGRVKYLHNKYIADSQPIQVNTSTSQGNHLSEDEIIRIALNSKNGIRFRLFMEGGWEQFYNSQSEADMAFANDLAFWTARDLQKMDSIFRRSSLYRDKYDSKRGDSTYGLDTLKKAISECSNVFNPAPKNDDFNLYILEDSVEEVKQRFYSYDDTGNAQRFTDLHKNILRYSHIRKNWYFYDGKRWQIDQQGKIKKLADKTIEAMQKESIYVPEGTDEEDAEKLFRRHVKYTRSHSGKNNMIKESQHLLPIKLQEFDSDPYLLNVQNGFLDLKTGTLNNHDKSKYFTRISNVEFTDKADHPLWDEFLNTIFNNDKTLISYVQRAVGYSLSGSTEEQMMFLLYGHGRNGKSVFLDIINELFGSYSMNIQPQSIMVKQQSNNANPDIAKLDGARFVTTTEPNEGMRFDEGLIKQLTGGDKVTARFLYEDEFEYIPQFKLWMATNHKPFIRGTDDGIWRRMAVIPFTVQIPEHKVDKQLTHKLKREINAILNWAVEGFLEWQRIGLAEPAIVSKQRQEYRTEMDSIELFIEESCIRSLDARVQASVAFQSYRDWAEENGQYKMSNSKFGVEMSKKFERVTINGRRYYKGFSIINDESSGVYRLNY